MSFPGGGWFRSFSFLFMGDGCIFQPPIFQGVSCPTWRIGLGIGGGGYNHADCVRPLFSKVVKKPSSEWPFHGFSWLSDIYGKKNHIKVSTKLQIHESFTFYVNYNYTYVYIYIYIYSYPPPL